MAYHALNSSHSFSEGNQSARIGEKTCYSDCSYVTLGIGTAMVREEVALPCAIDCAESLRSLQTREDHLLKYQKWLEQRTHQAETGAYPVIERAQDFVSLTESSRKSNIEDTFAKLFSITSQDPTATAVKCIWETIENIFTGEEPGFEV